MTKRTSLPFQPGTLALYARRAILFGKLSFFLIIVSLTSCVSAKYKMADVNTPPAVPLNLSAEAHSVNAQIDTVIIYGGSGSWKHEAYWDEYLLTITNRSDQPVDLTSATLIDFQGNPVMPGEDPWQIQEESKDWIKNYDPGTTGVVLKVGAASVLTGVVVGGGLAALFLSSAPGVTAAAVAPAVAVGVGAMAIIVAPFIALGTWGVNVEARKLIEAEFQSRRLKLPVTIHPGQASQGSLFFRITPGPKQMTLSFSGVEPSFEISVALAPLADLHIDTKPDQKKAQ
jgi:hypothetical protein